MPPVDSGFELYVEEGPERGRFVSLGKQTIKVGRKSNATRLSAWIQLDDPTLSKHHATLVWDSNSQKYRLLHVSKTNPTLVNDRSIDAAVLRANDVIRMGKVVLRLIRRDPSLGTNVVEAPAVEARPRRRTRWRIISGQDRVLFYHNLSVMLGCGIPILRCIEALTEQTENPWLHDTLTAIRGDLHGGNSLSGAMQAHSPPFRPMEVGLVRAGESSGTLPEVLHNLAEGSQKDLELVRQVKGSLTYPLTVLVAGFGLVLFLGQYAFKALLPVLLATGGQIPFTTQVLMTITHYTSSPPAVIVGLLLLGLALSWLIHYMGTTDGTLKRDTLLLHLPVVGTLMAKVAAARFCYGLTLLYGSGIPMIRALQEASETCGNARIAMRAKASYQLLSQGHTLAESLFLCHVFPPYMLSMVDVGETTGKLDDMLGRVASILDLEVRDTLDRVVKMLEPLTIAGMGLLVGFILLAAFQPIYGIIAGL